MAVCHVCCKSGIFILCLFTRASRHSQHSSYSPVSDHAMQRAGVLKADANAVPRLRQDLLYHLSKGCRFLTGHNLPLTLNSVLMSETRDLVDCWQRPVERDTLTIPALKLFWTCIVLCLIAFSSSLRSSLVVKHSCWFKFGSVIFRRLFYLFTSTSMCQARHRRY